MMGSIVPRLMSVREASVGAVMIPVQIMEIIVTVWNSARKMWGTTCVTQQEIPVISLTVMMLMIFAMGAMLH